MEYFSYKVYAEGKLKCTAYDDADSLATSLAWMFDRFGEELTIVVRRATEEEIEENEEVTK
jgi:hypothetical protein